VAVILVAALVAAATWAAAVATWVAAATAVVDTTKLSRPAEQEDSARKGWAPAHPFLCGWWRKLSLYLDGFLSGPYRQLHEPSGDTLGGIRMSLRSRLPTHRSQSRPIGKQASQRFQQNLRALQLALFNHYGRIRLYHNFCVGALMVVGSGGERDEQRGLAGCCQLGYR
jgi:hypothetical protein